jgi:hypothetical protein
MMVDCFHSSASGTDMPRPVVSTGPPAGKGTMKRTGRLG